MFEMYLDSLLISQLQQLHFKPWLSFDLLFQSHENSSCYLLTASIVVFLLGNPETCIMCAFHLPNVVCVTMKINHVILFDRSACFLMTGPCFGHLLCLRVIVSLACNLFTTQIHVLLFRWFTCLLLFGLYIDHWLVHVSPFD